jgi:transposase
LRELTADAGLAVLRLLCDRRDEISGARAQALNRMHRLFLELLPGGVPVKKSTGQYKALLARVRPRDPAGKMRRRMAAGELAGLTRLDAKLKAMKAEIKTAVQATGSRLMEIHGIGPAGAARILADVGDIARFPDRNHFASWTGTAPIDASSGEHKRHRLSRAGNRRLNHVLASCSEAAWPAGTSPPPGLLVSGACLRRPASDAEPGTSCTSSMRDMTLRTGPSPALSRRSASRRRTSWQQDWPSRCPSGAGMVSG